MIVASTHAGTRAPAPDRHTLAPVEQRRDWSGFIAQWYLEHQGDLARAAQSGPGRRSCFSSECQRTVAALLELADQRTLVTVTSAACVADTAGLSDRQVRRSLTTLSAAGWLEQLGPIRTGTPGRPAHGYRITLPGLLESVAQRQQRTSDDESAPAPILAGQVRRWSGWLAPALLELQGELDLTGAQRRVLLTLASYADRDTLSCFPSQDTLATGAGMTRRSVRRTLAQLEERRLIQRDVTGSGRRRRVRYWLTVPGLLEELKAPAQAVSAPVSAPQCATNRNTQLQVPTYSSSRDDSPAPGQGDEQLLDELVNRHLLECPARTQAGQGLRLRVRTRAVEALSQVRTTAPVGDLGPDQLLESALALMAQAIHRQRCEQTGAPDMTPEERTQLEERKKQGQVLLEAGLLDRYQQQCAGTLEPDQLLELVRQVAAGQVGHAHAADSAQEWLLEHERQDDESGPVQTGQVFKLEHHSAGHQDDEHQDDESGMTRADVVQLTDRLRARSKGHPWRV